MWAYLFLMIAVPNLLEAKPHVEDSSIVRDDPSCTAVNVAYIATMMTPEFVDTTYGLRTDGTLKFHDEMRVFRFATYRKLLSFGKWYRGGPPSASTYDRFGPVFTFCRLVGHQSIGGIRVVHYSATWHEFPYSAPYDLWVSEEDGKIVKALRDYSHSIWQFPFPIAIELFNYQGKPIPAPDSVAH